MRKTIVLLLTLLAVATIFTATSCKGVKSVISGDPYIPPEDGLYMDFGYGLNADPGVEPTHREMTFAPGFHLVNSDPIEIVSGEDLNDVIPFPFKGSQIIIAARLSPSDMENRTAIAANVTTFYLYPLTRVDEYRDSAFGSTVNCDGGCYICGQADIIKTVSADKSNYDKAYIYLEINDIPPSPTGWYGFYYAGTFFFLKQSS